MQDLELLRYPIGKYLPPATINTGHIQLWIEDLIELPQLIVQATIHLSEEQLETPYRPGGWTVRQVVHHLADSHINAYTRTRLTLTEDNPAIRPYFEERWAELPDARTGDIELSVAILKAIHQRWVALLKTLSPEDFERTYFHPETKHQNTLGYLIGNYAWHGKHHLAHIQAALKN
ncbi:bacillithiol transferase BstA [Pedobacter sp. KR3-3]|uniref:Bacillithiol transferase BstA n=1 Tax=Pedobacter albus TaxID=3113905 RepID=A0ABU7IAJ3_9SPHI|nr:bacillithiol transferase BstA [Pedobacter sp. KR3-3]MEE1946500.1 bacillithiol transferase BstA [Pedobacter sp. KR3-3]